MESEELKAMMEGLLKPLNDKIDQLAQENTELKEKLRNNMDLTEEGAPLPNHLRPAGLGDLRDPRAARHVVVATRPVLDSPNDPLWRNEHKSEPGLLVRNSRSKGMEGGE